MSPRVLEAPARLDDVRRELDEYFAGRRHEFETPVDWSHLGGFTRKVLRATARIPSVTPAPTPASPRRRSPRAVRAAGNALGSNRFRSLFHAIVLRTGGALGGYAGGSERKEYLLRLEGVLT